MAIPTGYSPLAKIGISYKGAYSSSATYTQYDAVYYNGSTYLALVENPVGTPISDGVNWRFLAAGAGTDSTEMTTAFTQASTRANIATGEAHGVLFGKIKKWLSDLTEAAFAQMINSYSGVMSNTTPGRLPDALAVKQGFESIANSSLAIQKKVVMIGDSYLAGSNTTTPSTDNWGVLVSGLMGWDNVSRYANPGGGYIKQAGSGTFVEMVSSGGVVYTAENATRLDVSLVICVGGINDGEVNTLTMFDAVKNFITNTKTLFPNAKIVLAYNWFCKNYPMGQMFGIKDACVQYDGVYFVDNSYMWCMNMPSYYTDGVHPNTYASKVASRIFAQWLSTGTDYCYGYPQSYTDNGLTLTFWYDLNNLNIRLQGTTSGANDNTLMKNIPASIRPYVQKVGFSAYVGNKTQLVYIFKDGNIKNIDGGYASGTVVDGYASISNELLR